MGLRKFFIKHGPGSVGKTAKTMCKLYQAAKLANSGSSKEYLLRLTLEGRNKAYKFTNLYQPIDQDKFEEAINTGRLSRVIDCVIIHEFPRVVDLSIRDPQLMIEINDVIFETIAKYVSGENRSHD